MILLICMSACQSRRPEGVQYTETASPCWTDTLYCFNDRFIARSEEGHWGMLDKEGNTLMTDLYDSIEFLDDDIALLSRFGSWYLSDKNGRIFRESTEKDSLEQHYAVFYEQLMESDRLSWESVLDGFDALETQCLAVRSHTMPAKEKAQLEMAFSELKSLRERASGQMTPEQEIRFRHIVSDYYLGRK